MRKLMYRSNRPLICCPLNRAVFMENPPRDGKLESTSFTRSSFPEQASLRSDPRAPPDGLWLDVAERGGVIFRHRPPQNECLDALNLVVDRPQGYDQPVAGSVTQDLGDRPESLVASRPLVG